MAKYGWIAFGISVALAVVAVIGLIAAGSAGWFDGGGYSGVRLRQLVLTIRSI
jgi:hypothetical protein